MNAPLTSFVVPVYRNRETLRPLCRRLEAMAAAAWPGEAIEVVLVDDASPDGAWAEIVALAQAYPWVRGVRLAQNGGQHRAVLAGFAEARGERLYSLDGDLQDPPEAAPRLRAALDGVDLVFAGRRGRYERLGARLTSALYRQTILRLIGLPPDAGMFFVVTAEGRDGLLRRRAQAPQVIGLIAASGLKVRSVPVERDARTVGDSAYTFARRLQSALRVWAAWRQARNGRDDAEGVRAALLAAVAERTPEGRSA